MNEKDGENDWNKKMVKITGKMVKITGLTSVFFSCSHVDGEKKTI